jgi:hypothetical protein
VGALPPIEDLDALTTTRLAWHSLAEHVLAAARYRAVGRIGLRATPGGYGTPPYERDDVRQELRIVANELHVIGPDDRAMHPLSTVAHAARVVGIEPGAPANVYEPSTSAEHDAPLAVDLGATQVLASWFELAWSVLEELAATAGPDVAPSDVTLWPEHFDAAINLGDEALGTRGTFGASPGDDEHPEPYLYVTHWADVPDDPYWNDSNFAGASLDYSTLQTDADPRAAALDFYCRGLEVLSSTQG